MNLRRALVVGAGVVAVAVVMGSSAASAHPLGNLTVNTSARIVVAPQRVDVQYVLDLAELPAVQERSRIAAAGSDAAYAAGKCADLVGGARVEIDGAVVPLESGTSSLERVPGQGGLDTLRVTCAFDGPWAGGNAALTWHDSNLTDRIGWREVVAVGDGTTLTTELPATSMSDYLRAYPTDVPSPRVLDAQIAVRHGGPRLATDVGSSTEAASEPQRRGADGLTAAFNRLVGDRHLTVGLGFVAAGIAFLLGAMHSLAPGHGKTMMAAMVASRRGTARQVLAMGGTVAATHTLGVVVLGVLVTTSQVVAPDRVLPWLTVASGLLLLATGAWLLGRRLLFGASLGHSHGTFGHGHHGHDHAGHDHAAHDHAGHDHAGHDHAGHDHAGHDHAGHDHDQSVGAPLRTRSLALVGMAGGLVPTPSALVVLLGATALGRAWFGVILVGVYGIGMAATLLAAGMLLVRLQGWLERQYAEARWLTMAVRVLPVATAALLILGGVSLAVRGAVAM